MASATSAASAPIVSADAAVHSSSAIDIRVGGDATSRAGPANVSSHEYDGRDDADAASAAAEQGASSALGAGALPPRPHDVQLEGAAAAAAAVAAPGRTFLAVSIVLSRHPEVAWGAALACSTWRDAQVR